MIGPGSTGSDSLGSVHFGAPIPAISAPSLQETATGSIFHSEGGSELMAAMATHCWRPRLDLRRVAGLVTPTSTDNLDSIHTAVISTGAVLVKSRPR